ncbi:hypothetical protein DPMN_098257 [Dreissena polymorpha]|uniref:Uncharacterized protein n=1 Tax=Dreissena polymorpha TaxID=45954 RepID=A0A9D4LEC7_DREPO|nr:hypothetical protein DPMN_098257 [Dreissena polymorpha]
MDYQLASQTLSGFCMIPDGPDRGVCDISSALANCTDKQTWLAAGDNQCRYMFFYDLKPFLM